MASVHIEIHAPFGYPDVDVSVPVYAEHGGVHLAVAEAVERAAMRALTAFDAE